MTRLYELFLRGGGLMWPLLVLSLAAVAITIERALALYREPTDSEAALAEVRAGRGSQLGGGLGLLLARWAGGRGADESLLQASGQEYVNRLEAPLSWLRAIAEVAPLLGFLGTVMGMIGAFDTMAAVGAGDSRAFSKDIAKALLTTAGGLSVAIPAYLAHSVLSARLDRVVAAMNRFAGGLAAGEATPVEAGDEGQPG